ncbi:MAG TPA: hypothetical protein VMZ11_07995 [Mycobacteriales bacterium]|nr:hypothetical protein [Mycobacteriales bacterium]
MTSEVIDSTHRTRCADGTFHREDLHMTSLTASTTGVEERLRTVLRVDAVFTGALGLFVLLGPSWYGGPAWVARAVGAVLAAVAVEVGLWARSSGERLRLTGLATAAAAFGWVLTLLVVLALVDMDTAGREVIALTALVTLAFGITETGLVRRMR